MYNTIEDYYNKAYNTEGILATIHDELNRQLIFYPINYYDENGNLIQEAKTFDENDVLTIQLRQREADLGEQLDLSDLEVTNGNGKGKKK